MLLLSFIFIALMLIVAWYLAYRRGLIFLQIAQQDEYSEKSLFAWYKDNQAFDKQVAALAVVGIILFLVTSSCLLCLLLGIIGLYLISVFQKDPRTQAKTPLVFTDRARRAFYLYNIFITASLCIFVNLFNGSPVVYFIFMIVFSQALPFIMMLTLILINKYEAKQQIIYHQRAKNVLTQRILLLLE